MDENKNVYDVVIIGGGPAGLTAAIYLARACYRVLVLEKETFGGQITITEEIVNYPGIVSTSGKELTEAMRKQAENFGAEFMIANVTGIDVQGDIKSVVTDKGKFDCFGILLASGAHPRKINFKGEEEYKGRGVAYCATCDGEFFTGKEVFVIGGGFAAAEESVFLTKYARHVTVIIRKDDFSCAKSVSDKTKANEKISIITNAVVDEVFGDSFVQGIKYHSTKTGEEFNYTSENKDSVGVFVFAGYEPATEFVKDVIELNEQGYIVTDKNQKTNVNGIYAAGDVCIKNLRQVVTATGDGALAATELERYASEMQEKTGIIPERAVVKKAENPKVESKTSQDSNELFSEDMLAQLEAVFSRMENPLILKLYLDSRAVSTDLENYMNSLVKLTDKLSVHIENGLDDSEKPCVKVCKADGTETGLAFHGVPGGHEFTSFILGIYNASGKGQQLDDETVNRINTIDKPINMKIMVSLTCTMCPDLVIAAQKIASINPMISAEVYDINHFEDMKNKYGVMSVPCMALNQSKVIFGKKNISQLLDIIAELE